MKRTSIAWLVAHAVVAIAIASTVRADEPPRLDDNIAGARGIEHAVKKLHAPLRETPRLSPADELKTFRVRDGFAVDLIASEPNVVQPLYLTFDERGRMWVVQYVQYPVPAGLTVVEVDQHLRAKFDKVPPAPPKHDRGRDVISILEDADGDGTFEKQKTFLEGLNITTAALPGRGGVWVLNPPYLLFYADKNRDDVPDGDPVVHLSGFGLQDTHSVASNLAWGPDGWLYGAHGSTVTSKVIVEVPTNRESKVESRKSIDFLGQCVWRYHPERHVFEIFAEGGGNTFGVAFDDAGRVYSGTNWGSFRGLHFVQGGYYVKGWGKHGPLTNPFAFGFFEHMPHGGPPADRLTHTFEIYGGGLLGPELEGKIIGPNPIQSRVSVTRLSPNGSTFKTEDEEPMLTSDDGWFRPVDLKTGPDGALYVADMYERRISHVDPRDNWDRTSGRIWRIRPKDWEPGYQPFDMSVRSANCFVQVTYANRWWRATGRRVLGDRKDQKVVPELREILARETDRRAVEALWSLNEVGAFDAQAALVGLKHANPVVRAWTLRLLSDERDRPLDETVLQTVMQLAESESDSQVRSQLASTAKRMDGAQAVPLVAKLVRRSEDKKDPHIPLLLWWALESKAVSHREPVLSAFATSEIWQQPLARDVIMVRLARRYAAEPSRENQSALVRLFRAAPGDAGRKVLVAGMNEAFAGGPTGELIPELAEILAGSGNIEIALRAGDADAHAQVLTFIKNDDPAVKAQRLRWIELLGQVGRPEAVPVLLDVAANSRWHSVKKAALAALVRFDDPAIPRGILGMYIRFPLDQGVRQTAVTTLASRPAWGVMLVNAIKTNRVLKSEVPADQVARLRKMEHKALLALVDEVFGPELKPTTEQKLKEFERVKGIVLAKPGDAARGKELFTARCAACHTLFGQGGKLAPDLTTYDRTDVDNMVMNVVDPGAYIREEFQTFGVRTKSGQTFVGVITERGPNQITIADSTGRTTTIPKADIKTERAMETSTMPDGLLDGLSNGQVQDLFTYLAGNGR